MRSTFVSRVSDGDLRPVMPDFSELSDLVRPLSLAFMACVLLPVETPHPASPDARAYPEIVFDSDQVRVGEDANSAVLRKEE